MEALTHETSLLERGNDTRLGRGGHDSHGVALVLDPLQLLVGTGALLALGRQLLGDLVELTGDEIVLLVLGHLEVVLLLDADEHVAEVVADELLQQLVDGVGGVNVVLLQHLVG